MDAFSVKIVPAFGSSSCWTWSCWAHLPLPSHRFWFATCSVGHVCWCLFDPLPSTPVFRLRSTCHLTGLEPCFAFCYWALLPRCFSQASFSEKKREREREKELFAASRVKQTGISSAVWLSFTHGRWCRQYELSHCLPPSNFLWYYTFKIPLVPAPLQLYRLGTFQHHPVLSSSVFPSILQDLSDRFIHWLPDLG